MNKMIVKVGDDDFKSFKTMFCYMVSKYYKNLPKKFFKF